MVILTAVLEQISFCKAAYSRWIVGVEKCSSWLHVFLKISGICSTKDDENDKFYIIDLSQKFPLEIPAETHNISWKI